MAALLRSRLNDPLNQDRYPHPGGSARSAGA